MISLGPVVAPVVGPKLLNAHTSDGLNGLAAIGRNTTSAPVRNRLRSLPKRSRQPGQPASGSDGRFDPGFCIHAGMVNAMFTTSQHIDSVGLHSPCMGTKNPVWQRVQDELDARGRGLKWLADALDTSVQRVQNWKARGLPPGAQLEVAVALNRSLDWLAGIAPIEREPLVLTDEERRFILALRQAKSASIAKSAPAQFSERTASEGGLVRTKAQKARALQRGAELGKKKATP